MSPIQHAFDPIQAGVYVLRARIAEVGGRIEGGVGRVLERLQEGVPAYGIDTWQGGWDPMMSEREGQYIVLGLIVGGIILMVLLMHFLNHRRRMAEMRYKALEALAREGAVTPKQVEEFISPQRSRLRVMLVAAWFLLVGGVMLMVIGSIDGGRGGEEMLTAGACGTVAAIALLATPIMLREFKKQGVL